MVAVTGAAGYEGTRVTDVVAQAGVGRNTFYKHFASRDECFLATIDGVVDAAAASVVAAYRTPASSWEERLANALRQVLELVAQHPAAARLCLVEAHCAGPEAVQRAERLDRMLERVLADGLSRSPRHRDMPDELVQAVVGGLRHVVRGYVRRDDVARIRDMAPSLQAWALGYEPPRPPLARPSMPPARFQPPRPEPQDARERMLQAITALVVEKGYQALSIASVADQAEVSLSTFYKNFATKDEAFVAALSDAEQRLLAVTLPAFSDAPTWPEAVRDGLHAFFGFLAGDPMSAYIGGVDVFSGGLAALEWHEHSIQGFQALLMAGAEQYPAAASITAEAVAGAIGTAMFLQARDVGAERLYEIAPLAVYIALSPFVGARAAAELARSQGNGKK